MAILNKKSLFDLPDHESAATYVKFNNEIFITAKSRYSPFSREILKSTDNGQTFQVVYSYSAFVYSTTHAAFLFVYEDSLYSAYVNKNTELEIVKYNGTDYFAPQDSILPDTPIDSIVHLDFIDDLVYITCCEIVQTEEEEVLRGGHGQVYTFNGSVITLFKGFPINTRSPRFIHKFSNGYYVIGCENGIDVSHNGISWTNYAISPTFIGACEIGSKFYVFTEDNVQILEITQFSPLQLLAGLNATIKQPDSPSGNTPVIKESEYTNIVVYDEEVYIVVTDTYPEHITAIYKFNETDGWIRVYKYTSHLGGVAPIMYELPNGILFYEQVNDPTIPGPNLDYFLRFFTLEETVSSPSSFLDVPLMNSLSFVLEQDIDNCDNPQALDNVLLKDQYYPGFLETDYLQKVCKCDALRIQFNSDFDSFTITLYNYCTDEAVKTFPYEIKEENLNVTETYSIVIRNHSGFPGYSRVYFNVGTPPIPLQVGQFFNILNNADGFNGTYEIIDIQNDTILGYQYIVINRNYNIAGPNSNATGEFSISTVDYNVFESQLDFLDVADGQYYIRIVATQLVEDEEPNIIAARSEPIDLKVEHEGTNQIIYRNFDNAFNITWTTGYIGSIRVESLFGHKRVPGGERTISRNSDYSAVKVSAKKTRTLTFETFMLPPYLHEKLSVVFDMDFKSINRVQVEGIEGYGEPEYIDRFLLANSSIKLEQVGWFDRYNSDDIGSITETGFLSIEDGLLKI